MLVSWLVLWNFFRSKTIRPSFSSKETSASKSPSGRRTIFRASTYSMTASMGVVTTARLSRAASGSIPVPTSGAFGVKSGTDWRCMFEPINARFASSCSRKGINEAAADTIWIGDTSM